MIDKKHIFINYFCVSVLYMSVARLLSDNPKSWCDINVNNLDVAGTLDVSGSVGVNDLVAHSARLTNTSSQLVLGTGNTLTISGLVPLASRTYAIPDAGANCSFFLTQGTQTISGNTTFVGYMLLPTSGGTPSQFNYYEEYSFSATYSGIWAASQLGTVNVVRVGKTVTISLPNISATANAASVISDNSLLPARFRPTNGSFNYQIIPGVDNGTNKSLYVTINASTGQMQISVLGGNFAGSGTSGFFSNSISYTVL